MNTSAGNFLNRKPNWLLVGALGLIWLVLSAFDLSRHSVPVNEIKSGGPPKDGIPAILKPEFVSAEKAGKTFLNNSDRVLGIEIEGVTKAYPIKILNWHEIVNDKIDGKNIIVSFCPLCGTGMVFDGSVRGQEMTFGVSGLLYQSDMLLYDHMTESLWSQIKSEAVAGPMMGAKLKLISSTHTTWKQWRKLHPKTLVLSTKTGFRRNYDRDPYKGYDKRPGLMFPVGKLNRDYHPKERVIGIEVNGIFKAYPFVELAKAKSRVKDVVNGQPLRIEFDSQSQTAVIYDKKGKVLPTVVGFWFAWYAFHPETQIFRGPSNIK
jgi:hypothetical protein